MSTNGKLREFWGIALIVAGIIGTLLPIIPGFVLIAAGVAVLGQNHFIVRRSRHWLEKKGILKPKAGTEENDPLETCTPSSTGVGSKHTSSKHTSDPQASSEGSKIDEEALKK